MKKEYLYIGQYYHMGGKELPDDFKVGVTSDLKNREYNLSRTNSPIKYILLRAWEIPSRIRRTDVEKLIELIFFDSKYDSCEWYNYDREEFQSKISLLLETLNTMIKVDDINFKEINLNSDVTIQDKIETDIRETKKSDWSNIRVNMDNTLIQNKVAAETFADCIHLIIQNVGIESVVRDFSKHVKILKEDFPPYKVTQLRKRDGIFIDCHSSTNLKIKILRDMCNLYNLNCLIEKIS